MDMFSIIVTMLVSVISVIVLGIVSHSNSNKMAELLAGIVVINLITAISLNHLVMQ